MPVFGYNFHVSDSLRGAYRSFWQGVTDRVASKTTPNGFLWPFLWQRSHLLWWRTRYPYIRADRSSDFCFACLYSPCSDEYSWYNFLSSWSVFFTITFFFSKICQFQFQLFFWLLPRVLSFELYLCRALVYQPCLLWLRWVLLFLTCQRPHSACFSSVARVLLDIT